MTFDEQEIKNSSICSLIHLKTPDKAVLAPAYLTTAWVLKERFLGSIPNLQGIRARYMYHWHKYWGSEEREGQTYWEGPKASIHVAAKLYEFILQHEVVQPIEPYNLTCIDGHIITGSTALINRKHSKKGQLTYALDLIPYYIGTRRPIIPSYIALCRWLQARNVHDNCQLGILHLPILRGTLWYTEEIAEVRARHLIDDTIRQLSGKIRTIRPGSYCQDCTARCQLIYGSNDNSIQGW
jgi:hypothetical protein